MAISVNLIYQGVDSLISKELGTGYMRPLDFNIQSQIANVELFNKYADEYQTTNRVTDKLLPFITPKVLMVDSTGKMLYPSDYVNTVAIRAFEPDALDAATAVCDADDNPELTVDYNSLPQIKVKVIDNDKLGDRLSSSVLKPDKYHPIASFYSGYAKIYPPNIGSVVFEYLKQPATPVWGYTLDANDLEVYSSATSTNFDFNWLMQNELIIKICSYFGVSVREEQLFQVTKVLENDQK